ncbi:MAG: PQQ-dependent sugar dehydrogenase [Terricaulis sp.]
MIRWAKAAGAALVLLASACAQEPAVAPDPGSFRKVVLAGPFNEPVDLDVLADGSVLFVEKAGKIYHWTEAGGAAEIGVLTNVFASARTDEGNEFGLVAITADPAFAENGFIYVMYDTKPADRPVQRIARFHLDGARLDMSSETVVLEYPVEDNCCHTGGGMEFGRDGLLYVSTGDNTNPWSDDGYGPMDARPGRERYDALRSAGNTNDLRGKILRLRVTPAGGYEIPEGNLFAQAAQGRPEIYVMGARNPYTLSIDPETNAVYFGDVGPDANDDSAERGSRGYDEINRITGPANTGWPLFIGDNQPYHAHDYATNTNGPAFDPAHPVNASPRNTGARELPPAQPALIFYPYAQSDRFPMLGEGGRNALVAGVYRRTPQVEESRALPRYYDGKLFIGDFMRHWMMAVTLDDAGAVANIEPFAPGVELAAPLDMEFGPDGALYVIEYGSEWFKANPDSALSRIEYTGGGD